MAIFPEDFTEINHPVVPEAKQWLLKDKEEETIISVVGGGRGLYGNGIDTFEMFDFREDEPQGHLTKDEINEHLIKHPIV